MNIHDIIAKAVQLEASDIHIAVGLKPIIRVHTNLFEMDDMEIIDQQLAKSIVVEVLDKKQLERFEEQRDIDFSMTAANNLRFRVNAHYERGSICMALRVIKSEIPTLEQLCLPQKIADLADLPRGLVLVTGPTGSGKSTTLASMVELINSKYNKRIITLEDPIEYELTSKLSVITQREIGHDCLSFASGLKHVLRQDPDVILVGEMRDLETISAAITAAETGHIVFSTLHTNSAAHTIERIIDVFPAVQQRQICTMLANTLQAVISQTLFKRIDTAGMYPCTELMLCTPGIRSCIRESRVVEIPNYIETGRGIGMHTMDISIAEAVTNGYIDREEALARANDPGRLFKMLDTEGALQTV
jgi:twitching motility protein PilT